jgi:hypothetical protein
LRPKTTRPGATGWHDSHAPLLGIPPLARHHLSMYC